MNYISKYIVAGIIIILAASSISATIFKSDDRYFVQPTDTLDDDAILALREGALDGVISGDLIVVGQKFTVNGQVDGNFNCAAQYATVRGQVSHSCRIFAQVVTINGQINNNLIAFANSIDISRGSVIGRDATLMASEISLNGQINGNLLIRGDKIILSGVVDGDIDIEGGPIALVAPAEFKGNIKYRSVDEIQIDSGVVIDGEVEWDKIDKNANTGGGINWPLRIILFLCSLVTGLVLIPLFKTHAGVAFDSILTRPMITIGTGFIAFCAAPLAIAILAIMIVGIPAAAMTLFAYATFLYVGKIYVAIALGRLILKMLNSQSTSLIWPFILGLIILMFVFAIPVLGTIVYLATLLMGMGAIIQAIMQCHFRKINGTENPKPLSDG